MTEECCRDHHGKRKKLIGRLGAGLLILTFTLLAIVLLITWAILQPKTLQFTLQDATIHAFNVSVVPPEPPFFVTLNLHVTVCSRNPNDKIGVYYDKLDVYATYNNQQVTYLTTVPPTYQDDKDVNVWSPIIYGVNMMVLPYNGASIFRDQVEGAVRFVVEIEGRVRFKVGSFVSRPYRLHVKCPALIGCGYSPLTGVGVGNGVKYHLAQSCRLTF